MEWVDFMFKAAGYQYKRNGQLIHKDELYDRIKNSEKYYDRKDYMNDVLEGKSNDYERVESEHWRNGECYFNYDVNPVSGKIYKSPTLMPAF